MAIAICSCENISGIWRNGVENKVALYADNLLSFISHPGISLPAMLSLLNNFSQFSGYKLNLNKSELFPVSEGTPASDYSNFPFRIVENKFTYLGITVTKKHTCLFRENFLIFLKQKMLPDAVVALFEIIPSKWIFSLNFCMSSNQYWHSFLSHFLRH